MGLCIDEKDNMILFKLKLGRQLSTCKLNGEKGKDTQIKKKDSNDFGSRVQEFIVILSGWFG